MAVKQISVFIQNKPGQAFKPISVLGGAGVDLCAVSIADTSDFGILRMIARDNEKAVKVLKDAGFTTIVTDLVGAIVDNTPGGLSKLLAVFEKENLNIEYFYSYLPRKNEEAVMFFKVSNPEDAIAKLKKNKIQLISTDTI